MNPETLEYEIQKLNLLAFPRNELPKCSLTGSTANVQLVTPHCTLFYATESHAEQAWHGIVKKVSHLIAPLLNTPPIIGTKDERARRTNNIALSKKSLIDFCLAEAQNLLSSEKYQLAIPGAIQSLKFSKELFGDMSVENVEPYLILAQASLGMHSPRQAEEYLALAKWIVLNDEKCSDRVKSRLHQLLGRLHTAEGKFEDAKTAFASSIFFSAKTYGAEAIATAIGYYNLGDVFIALGNIESALAFFDKVVDIWYKYLSGLHSQALNKMGGRYVETPENTTPLGDVVPVDEPTEAQLTDGKNHLLQILDNRQRLLGDNHIATGEVQYSLGLFEFFILGNEEESARYMGVALEIYQSQLGASHASTLHVSAVLSLVNQQVMEKEGGVLQSNRMNTQAF